MWRGLVDQSKQVRLITAAALKACLAMIGRRRSDQCQQWYNDIYDKSIARLSKQGTKDLHGLHGSLLVIEELLREPRDNAHPQLPVQLWAS